MQDERNTKSKIKFLIFISKDFLCYKRKVVNLHVLKHNCKADEHKKHS